MLPARRGRLDEIAAAILATALADPAEDPGHCVRAGAPGSGALGRAEPGNRRPASEGGRNEGRHRTR
jgi:hypothetical protein